MKKNEALVSNIIRCFIAGLGFKKRTSRGWHRLHLGVSDSNSISHYFGVNRLNGDDGACVLMIRQSTYSERPALLSDIKY